MHGQFLEYSIKCLENFPLAIPLSIPRNPFLDCVTIIVGKWAGDTWYMIYSIYRWYMAHSVNWYPHKQNGGRVAEGHLSPSGSDLRIFFLSNYYYEIRFGMVKFTLHSCTFCFMERFGEQRKPTYKTTCVLPAPRSCVWDFYAASPERKKQQY